METLFRFHRLRDPPLPSHPLHPRRSQHEGVVAGFALLRVVQFAKAGVLRGISFTLVNKWSAASVHSKEKRIKIILHIAVHYSKTFSPLTRVLLRSSSSFVSR